MKTKVFSTAVTKVNNFYKSNLAIWFFMSASTIFAIVQVVLYATNSLQVNGTYLEDGTFWEWILLAISILSCFFGFMGGIMLFREDLTFVYWQTASTSMAALMQFLAGMWFGGAISVFFVIMSLIRFYAWRGNYIEKWGFKNTTILTSCAIFFFILLSVFIVIVYFFGQDIYSTSKWMKPRNYYADVTGATFNATAAILMLFKSRWCFALYATSKIFTIFNYAEAGLITPIVQMILFWVMDFTGFIGWSLHLIEAKEVPLDYNL